MKQRTRAAATANLTPRLTLGARGSISRYLSLGASFGSSGPSRSNPALLFSAVHIVRRPAPASRPSGRSAVGLRPSPDPDASPRRAQTTAEEAAKPEPHPLDRPRSFRDDPRVTETDLPSIAITNLPTTWALTWP